MRLNLNPGVEAYRLIEAAGLVIHARPALADLIEEAKTDPAVVAHAASVDAEADPLSPEALRARNRGGLLMTKALARLVIEAWEGVEDPDGSPAPVTPDRIDALLDIAPVYDAFTSVYLSRWLTVQAEKNGSSPSPTGISAAARTTAKPARPRAKTARAG